MGKNYTISRKEENGKLYISVKFDGKVCITSRKPKAKIIKNTTKLIAYRGSRNHFTKVIEDEAIIIKEDVDNLIVTAIYDGEVIDEEKNVSVEVKPKTNKTTRPIAYAVKPVSSDSMFQNESISENHQN